MAVTDVMLRFQGQTSDTTSKKRSYSSVYRVIVDDPLDGQTVVENAPGIPFYGAFYIAGNTVDPLAVCKTKRAARVEGTRLVWDVEVQYETPDGQDNKDDAKNRDDDGKPSDNPLDWRDRWEWVGVKYTKPLEKATLAENLIPKVRQMGVVGPPVNAAGTVFDPPAEMDDSRALLRITKFMKTFPSKLASEYRDAVNSDTVRIKKPALDIMIEPYTAKLEPISGALQWWVRADGVQVPYCEVHFEIVMRGTWRFNMLNRGYFRLLFPGAKDANGRELSPTDIIDGRVAQEAIRNQDGSFSDVPAMLDFDGQPLPKTSQEPRYIPYIGYPELPFAKLKL